METSNVQNVSFVGGPYDGCVSARQSGQALAGQIAMPVSSSILSMLAGEPAREAWPIRAVALYRLVLTPRGPRYSFHRFHGIPPEQRKELSGWHQALLSAWNKILQQQRK